MLFGGWRMMGVSSNADKALTAFAPQSRNGKPPECHNQETGSHRNATIKKREATGGVSATIKKREAAGGVSTTIKKREAAGGVSATIKKREAAARAA